MKHRAIQDLRRNQVNDTVRMPERQVLPSGIDHARDWAIISDEAQEDTATAVLILDFKDAFMSVPLHESEQPYNCAVVQDRYEFTSPFSYPWRG